MWDGLKTEKFKALDEHQAVAAYVVHQQRRAAWAVGEGAEEDQVSDRDLDLDRGMVASHLPGVTHSGVQEISAAAGDVGGHRQIAAVTAAPAVTGMSGGSPWRWFGRRRVAPAPGDVTASAAVTAAVTVRPPSGPRAASCLEDMEVTDMGSEEEGDASQLQSGGAEAVGEAFERPGARPQRKGEHICICW